ncbi:MAG: DoxX family membrane protein [Nitriliruptoraceae bacterium]
MARGIELFLRLDDALVAWLRRVSVPLMRIVLGLVFVWFGALKVIGYTPATELIAGTVYLFDPATFVRLLGAVEVLIGIGFLTNRAMRLVLLLFTGLMVGTGLTFVMLPELMFAGSNPLLITVEGGYVAKNVVLLVAGMVVASQLHPPAVARVATTDPAGTTDAGS